MPKLETKTKVDDKKVDENPEKDFSELFGGPADKKDEDEDGKSPEPQGAPEDEGDETDDADKATDVEDEKEDKKDDSSLVNTIRKEKREAIKKLKRVEAELAELKKSVDKKDDEATKDSDEIVDDKLSKLEHENKMLKFESFVLKNPAGADSAKLIRDRVFWGELEQCDSEDQVKALVKKFAADDYFKAAAVSSPTSRASLGAAEKTSSVDDEEDFRSLF